MQVVAFGHHAAGIDANPKFDLAISGTGGDANGQCALHLDCAANRINDTGKLGKQAVTHGFENSTVTSRDVWFENLADAEDAFDFFIRAYRAKYDKAADCLTKDRDRLLTFYDFPAEHWKHVRSTNPIESTFATVRLGTAESKGCLSRNTALALVFKLLLSARQKWRRLDRSNHLAQVIQGVTFKDGITQIQNAN